jgi:iron complex outermembrane receptor protein
MVQVVGNLYANTGANDPSPASCWAMRWSSTPIMKRWRVRPGQVQPHAALSLTLGGRYNYDRNDQRSAINIDPVPIFGQSVNFTATGTAPTADFRYGVKQPPLHLSHRADLQLSKDVMLYATYSTGYKPGGIAFVGNKYDPYNPDR